MDPIISITLLSYGLVLDEGGADIYEGGTEIYEGGADILKSLTYFSCVKCHTI